MSLLALLALPILFARFIEAGICVSRDVSVSVDGKIFEFETLEPIGLLSAKIHHRIHPQSPPMLPSDKGAPRTGSLFLAPQYNIMKFCKSLRYANSCIFPRGRVMDCVLYYAARSALPKETVARAEAAVTNRANQRPVSRSCTHLTIPSYTVLLSSELSMTLLSFVLAFTSSSLS